MILFKYVNTHPLRTLQHLLLMMKICSVEAYISLLDDFFVRNRLEF